MTKRFLAALVCLVLALTLLPATALAADPELALWDNAANAPASLGTDYTYDTGAGVLSIIKPGDYTLSMVTFGSTTAHRVIVDNAGTKLTLDNVRISGSFDGNAPNGGEYPLDISAGNTLTLKGTNTLTNTRTDNFAYGMRTGRRTPITIQGDGSLTIMVPDGDPDDMQRAGIEANNSNLLIRGGNIRISAPNGIRLNTNSAMDPATEGMYEQTGGTVHITAGQDGINMNVVTLSGGTLEVRGGGSNSVGVFASWGVAVSGGDLRIQGDFLYGLLGLKVVDSDPLPEGTGLMSFTGGVTDISVPAGSPAVYSLYSDSTHTGSTPPAYPPQPITVGGNMRVTAGGAPVWSDWIHGVDWETVATFSQGSVTIDPARGGLIGASSHVHIEPATGGADGDSGLGADVPKTGDSAPIAPLCGMALLCGLALLARRRKRSN